MFSQIAKTCLVLFALAALCPVAALSATLEITGPPGASLIINDVDMGFFPLEGPLELEPGPYHIKSEYPGHITYEHELRLIDENDWQRVTVRLVPLSRKTAWTSNILFAGLGQHYMGSKTRGYIYNLAEAGGLVVALVAEMGRSNSRSDYLDLQEQYNSSINADDISRYREAMDEAYNDMLDQEDLRNTGLMVAAGAIVVSILDAIILFPSVEAGAGPVPVDMGSLDSGPGGPGGLSDTDPLTAVHAAVRLEF